MNGTALLEGDRRNPPKKKKERSADPLPFQEPLRTGPYTILWTEDAKAGYEDLPGNIKASMDEIVERLTAWPEVSGARTLFGKGFAPGKFRMKTWDWRIEFQVNESRREIAILRIGHRETFYDEYH